MLEEHWEDIYQTRDVDDVSWFQQRPECSLQLIERTPVDRHAPIIDVGAGASHLADHLLQRGYDDLTLLDLSATALEHTKQRLSKQSTGQLSFLQGDVLTTRLPRTYSLWHDRAVFHFLTEPEQRLAYRRKLDDHLDDDGYLIIATFNEDGPRRCSGLPVVRYSLDELESEFGDEFDLLLSRREMHQTPAGRSQSFVFALFERR